MRAYGHEVCAIVRRWRWRASAPVQVALASLRAGARGVHVVAGTIGSISHWESVPLSSFSSVPSERFTGA